MTLSLHISHFNSLGYYPFLSLCTNIDCSLAFLVFVLDIMAWLYLNIENYFAIT